MQKGEIKAAVGKTVDCFSSKGTFCNLFIFVVVVQLLSVSNPSCDPICHCINAKTCCRLLIILMKHLVSV